MKKFVVLGVLFILPIVAYLFFASGIHNFAKLPVLTQEVNEIEVASDVKLQDHITVLGFLGEHPEKMGPTLFNLSQKIYKYFYEFQDFQFVYLLPQDANQKELAGIISELDKISDLSRWHFVFAERQKIKELYESLQAPHDFTVEAGSPYVYIIDKNRRLRGRDDDEDVGELYGYKSTDIAELANKMKDDVKIVLAEYRLALKKNNADRS